MARIIDLVTSIKKSTDKTNNAFYVRQKGYRFCAFSDNTQLENNSSTHAEVFVS